MATTGGLEIEEEDYSWSLEKLARYPFITEASEYIMNQGPSLEELIEDPLWSRSRSRGLDRVMQSITNGKIVNKTIQDEVKQEIELFSYPVARMLVSCVSNDYLIRRYALGESEKFLVDLEREDTNTILRIGYELDIETELSNGNIRLSFIDYLENTEHLKAPEWKLINQDLRDGYVYLSLDKFVRVQKETLFLRIINELPRPVNDTIEKTFEDEIKQIERTLEETRSEFESVEFGEVKTELFPPCIKKLIALQKEGVNLSHEERFALTSFLHKVGLSEDEIISIFSESPDFKRDMAEYQIEHITGIISGTEYTPPNCDTMKTNGICYDPDTLCEREWMTHTLKYYSVKKKGEKKED